MRLRKVYSLYPVLFGISPVLSLYAANIDRVSPIELSRALGAALAGSLVILGAARLAFRDTAKACAYTSLFLLVFFSYQTVMDAAAGRAVMGIVIGRHRYVYGAYILLLALLFILFLRSRRDFSLASRFFAVMAAAMVITPAARIAYAAVTASPGDEARSRWASETASVQSRARESATEFPAHRPDIYYIVLDCYLREDVLREFFGYDNSAFTAGLRELGFYVADRSFSNYPGTYMSLASSLNGDYLDAIQEAAGRRLDTGLLRYVIADNRACRTLRGLGYQAVFFPSGWDVTADSRCADRVMAQTRANLSQFERIQMERSMLKILTVGAAEHRKRVLRTFEMLAELAEDEKPTFAFAHVVCPHPPYVFDREGGVPALAHVPEKQLDDEAEAKLYLEQLEFLNGLVLKTVREIVRRSPDSIIILQSDHGIFLGHIDPAAAGSDPWEKLPKESRSVFARCAAGILIACRMPRADSFLYPEITPVNLFRAVMNGLFDAGFDMLPDRVFVHGNSRRQPPESAFWELVEWRP